ncbi:MAG: DUF29 domain-containing protein [Cyanobacteria bacterium P01_G01_bin.54]
MKPASLYETDFALWVEQPTQHLQQRNFNAIDWDNIQEEIAMLGRSDHRELENRLEILLEHLLSRSARLQTWPDYLHLWCNGCPRSCRGSTGPLSPPRKDRFQTGYGLIQTFSLQRHSCIANAQPSVTTQA